MAKYANIARRAAIVLVLAGTVLVPPVAAVAAGDRGKVTACSRFGNGCVTAQVRQTPKGPQYRGEAGDWVWCGYSCEETLRVRTVDFWEQQGGLTAEGDGRLWRRLSR
ncbi:MAG: hypothetical protein MUC37_13790 [Hyphomicrobium sp.]|nr:hypothetical protein [Hyphomicrobium sp.]